MIQRLDVAVIGTGNWGTTLALVLARGGRNVTLFGRNQEEVEQLQAAGENSRFLPGQRFPANLGLAFEPGLAAQAQVILLAVPSKTIRSNALQLAPLLAPDTIVLSCAKGIETGSLETMSEVLAEALSPHPRGLIGALSGPNIANEIAQGLPSTSVVALSDDQAGQRAQSLLTTTLMRIYRSSDVIGVELGGALKNIVALGAGICDGMGLGDNAKAAFITRGLAEMTRLGMARGAHPLTFAGLAGLGDLIATCASPHSRNRRLGEALARGQSLETALAQLGQVAEGVNTTATQVITVSV